MSEIEFRTEFVDSDQDIEIPEDTTLADLSIYVGDDNLTRNRPRDRSRLAQPSESVFGPVAGLADWFIENWMAVLWETHTPFKKNDLGEGSKQRSALPGVKEATSYWSEYLEDRENEEETLRQRWVEGYESAREPFEDKLSRNNADLVELADWQHRHLLGHVSSNLALPSIVLLPEGPNIVLAVDRLPRDLDASVDFLGPDKQARTPTLFTVRKTAFKAEAQAFVDGIIERDIGSQRYPEWAKWLKDRWQASLEEEADPKRRLRCMLGEVSASRVESLQSKNEKVLAQGLEQLLLDCPIVTDKSSLGPVEAIVSEFIAKERSSLFANEVAGWQSVGQATISPQQPDFEQGWKLARVVRGRLGIGIKPIKKLKSILDPLDVELQDSKETPLFRAAVCARRQGRAHIIPSSLDPRMESPSAYRFAVVSALGRLLWESRITGSKPICAAQGDHAMLSQSRRANAFAAEFLLPSEAIQGLGPHNPELWRTAETYEISHSAAAWHAYNVATRMLGRDS
jgi:hypothetical protein